TQTPDAGTAPNLSIQRLFIVANDDDENVANDIEISNPAPNEEIRFRADLLNTGEIEIDEYNIEVRVDGFLFDEIESATALAPGSDFNEFTEPWSISEPGFHTVTWHVNVRGDLDETDNTRTLHFVVGDPVGVSTPTPTQT